MITRKLIFSLILLSTTTSIVMARQDDLTLAYLENGLNELSNNKKQLGLQFMADELVKGSDLHMSILSVNTFSEIKRLIKSGEIDYLILNSFYYISHYDFLHQFFKDSIWAVQRGMADKENYILVTSNKYADQNLKQLKGKSISFHPQYLLMKLYLKYLIKQSNGLDIASFFKKIKHTRTASQAILDVFFGVSDVCIVPKHIFELTADLNPAIKQKLSVFHQSGEKFLPVLIFDLSHTIPSHKHIHKNLSTISNTVRGRQLLEMLNIEAIRLTDLEQLKPMRELFHSYNALSTN